MTVTAADLRMLEAAAIQCEDAPPRQSAAHLAPKLRDLAKRLVPMVRP